MMKIILFLSVWGFFASAAGGNCPSEMGIKLPQDKVVDGKSRNLPDPRRCRKTGSEECAGWTFIRTYRNHELLTGSESTVFSWEGENTLCLSVFRPQGGSPIFQVQCYNKTNCNACAYSGFQDKSRASHISGLSQPNQLGGGTNDCSKCHATGPILLKKQLFDDLKVSTAGLSKVCAGNGGPRWGEARKGWTQADKKTIVSSPESCASCHPNFVKRNTGGFDKGFCQLLKVALENKYGSMHEHKFASEKEQKDFFLAMGCTKSPEGSRRHKPSGSDDDDDDDEDHDGRSLPPQLPPKLPGGVQGQPG